MKILVLWADNQSANLGVRALARGSEELLRGVWPDADIELANYGNRPPELLVGRARAYLKEWALGRVGTVAWLRTFDLIWDTRSGDSFTDLYGLRRHITMCNIHEMAHRARTPVVLAPQTIGPFTTKRGRAMARRCLATSKLVLARDPVSATAARSLGRTVDGVFADLVFALPPTTQPQRSRDVILNVSGLLWNKNPHVDFHAYRATIEHLVESLTARGRTVSLLAHVLECDQPDNDVPVVRALGRQWGLEAVLPQSLTDVRNSIASSNVVIAGRMHACLNALSMGIPAIPMAYSRKFGPLMESLGWDWGVDLRKAPQAAVEILGMVEQETMLLHAAEATAQRGREGMRRLAELTEGALR